MSFSVEGVESQADLPKTSVANHIRELRTRFTRAGCFWLVAAVIAYVTADEVMELLRQPIVEMAQTREVALNYGSLSGAFDLKLKLVLYLSLILVSPIWLYEIVSFVIPGLTRREKRFLRGLLAACLPLFSLGCATGAYIFPQVVQLLTSFAAEEETTWLEASYYLRFAANLILTTGIAFTAPAVVVVLNLIGILPARTLVKTWKGVVVAVVAFSGVVTPAADLLSMGILSGVLLLLFAIAFAVAWLHDNHHPVRGRAETCSA